MRNCGNCNWSYASSDIERLNLDDTELNNPQVGDCCLGIDHEGKYFCKEHSFTHNNYILYDEKYLGKGYFIITELDGEIIKFIKIYETNNYGFTSFALRGYEKGSYDRDEDFRKIEINVSQDEELYACFNELANNLKKKTIPSIDPIHQGRNHMYVTTSSNEASLALLKDVFKVVGIGNFIDVLIGDDYSCDEYDYILNFYNQLSSLSIGTTKDQDIEKILQKICSTI